MNSKTLSRQVERKMVEPLEPRCLMSGNNLVVTPTLSLIPSASSSSSISGYTPAQIKIAYGISSISLNSVTGDGTGQTIAIVDAYSDPNIASDLAVFDKQFSLSAPASFKQVSATGSTKKLPASDAGWDSEIALDVEWAHAIAPKANIILVDAASDSVKNLMAAVKYASSISTVSVISMSWGTSEFSGESSYDSYFTTPAGHIGITYVAASGDEGAAGGAEFPASSPNVLSVGGTTLSITSSGTVSSESAWSDSSGGTSSYEKASAAQSKATGTTYRQTPDVSYDANPNTGFAVYDSVSYDGDVGWQEVGGTSAGAPQWAALVAIADQERAAKGSSSLDGATGTLPAIYSIYASSTSYAADFSDITSGSSSLGRGFGGAGGGRGRFGGRFGQSNSVSATTGFDTLTGVGTPKAAALIGSLASATVSKSAKAATSRKTAVTSNLRAAAAAEIAESAIQLGVRSLPFKSAERAAVALLAETFPAFAPLSFNSTNWQGASASPSALSPEIVGTPGQAVAGLFFDSADHTSERARFSIASTLATTANVLESKWIPASLLDSTVQSIDRPVMSAGALGVEMTQQQEAVSPPLVAVTSGLLIADAIVLGVYHARRNGRRKQQRFDLFSNTAFIA